MRYLVISDVHGNAPALELVLLDAPSFDALLCLGDMVGYGPNPNECISRIQDFDLTCLAGNHDWGAVGKADLFVFNREARQALQWTQEQLTEDNARFLRDLSPKLSLTDDILICHGSPRDPVWEYLVDASSAAANFRQYEFQILLVGHSHLPLVLEWREDREQVTALRPDLGVRLNLERRRLILNPGSVGQPRDGNPDASYAMLDTDEMAWWFRRVAYPVEITQERMRAQKLPRRLIARLEVGR
ncbi:MAG: metallophosphoesterase family protein [Anaerolineae bacterium]